MSDDMAASVYKMHDKGLSQKRISATLHISRCAVQRALQRRIVNSTQQEHVQCGPPRCTFTGTDRAITMSIKRDRFA